MEVCGVRAGERIKNVSFVSRVTGLKSMTCVTQRRKGLFGLPEYRVLSHLAFHTLGQIFIPLFQKPSSWEQSCPHSDCFLPPGMILCGGSLTDTSGGVCTNQWFSVQSSWHRWWTITRMDVGNRVSWLTKAGLRQWGLIITQSPLLWKALQSWGH